MTSIHSMTSYSFHARELETMLHNHPIVRSVTLSVLALVRHHSTLVNIKAVPRDDIWWPFVTQCWLDLCTYGMCCYTKKKIPGTGIVYPEHIPVLNCNMTILTTGEIELMPRFGKYSSAVNSKRKFYTYTSEEPNYRLGVLKSPLARVLASFKRLSRFTTMTLELESQITNPCLYLEDAVSASRGTSIYESVSSSNPDWQSTIPGLSLGAQDRANQYAHIDNYIGTLQEALVSRINGSADPKSQVDDLGLTHGKRKRVADTQIPLPQGRRAVFNTPSNRTNVLEYEEWFQREVAWVFGFPLSFFENNQSRVASNHKLLESISIAALRTQADIINLLLSKVSDDIFGVQARVIRSPMRVRLELLEESVAYNDSPKVQEGAVPNKSPAAAQPKPVPKTTTETKTKSDTNKAG